MSDLRIYISPVMGISSTFNHVFIYNPDSSQFISTKGIVGRFVGNEPDRTRNNPYININVPKGTSTSKFFNKVSSYPGWNKGIYIPFINDCFTQLEGALEYANKPLSLSEKGINRIDIGRDLQEITTIYFNVGNMSSFNKEVYLLLYNYCKSHHKFKNITGNLLSSLTIKPSKSGDIIYFSAKYAEMVMLRTQQDFLREAVEDNKETIIDLFNKHYQKEINSNRSKIDNKVSELGTRVINEQFSQIFRD